MKKSLFIITTLLFSIMLTSFVCQEKEDKTYYYLSHLNVDTNTLYISNVFDCKEYPTVNDCSEYLENDLNYKLGSWRDTHSHSGHEERHYVVTDREEEIEKWGDDEGYSVVHFSMSCDSNGNLK
jgi:hypothetical protein